MIGRKGSGKTAIFKKFLTDKKHDYFCFGHTFSDYPWHHHDLQARTDAVGIDRFLQSWKYLIALTVSKIILNIDASLPHDEESARSMCTIESFVVDTYGTRDPDVSQVFSPSKHLRLAPHFELDFKLLKLGVSPAEVPMSELPTIVTELNANLTAHCMRALNPEHRYYVCFDQLDLGFDPASEDYKDRLTGLLLAARDINILARSAGVNLFVIIFLRDDIYNELHFEDKNKLTENYRSLIEWDTVRTRRTLKSLMEKRFDLLVGARTSWEHVFDETKEMPGHQSKYQHILDRTFLRPRDIIKFCNSVLRQYQIRASTEAPVGSQFGNVDINQAKVEYSGYFVNEIDDEVHKHLPDYEDLMDVLRDVGAWQFSLEVLETALEKSSRLSGSRDVRSVLQDLYDFSLVGFYRPGGKGYGGSEYVFRYKENRARLDMSASIYRVHPGLIEELGLKRVTSDST